MRKNEPFQPLRIHVCVLLSTWESTSLLSGLNGKEFYDRSERKMLTLGALWSKSVRVKIGNSPVKEVKPEEAFNPSEDCSLVIWSSSMWTMMRRRTFVGLGDLLTCSLMPATTDGVAACYSGSRLKGLRRLSRWSVRLSTIHSWDGAQWSVSSTPSGEEW